MSLGFGAATSDRVEVPHGSTIDNLTAFTIDVWVYPTTITNSRRMWIKGNFVGTPEQVKHFSIDGAGTARVVCEVGRATTSALARSANSTIVTNVWQRFAATYSEATGARIYRGTLDSPMAEVAYTSNAVGSGATASDTPANTFFRWGNTGASSPTLAFQGLMAYGGYYAMEMTLAQLSMLPFGFDPRFAPRLGDCRLFHILGLNGPGTQIDLSGHGNHGAVVGATLATDHQPALRNLRVAYADLVAAAASIVPRIMYDYRRRRVT